MVSECARGGGGGRMGGKGRGGRRNTYGSRMPILIRHRNPASASYYEHKDVCFTIMFQIKYYYYVSNWILFFFY